MTRYRGYWLLRGTHSLVPIYVVPPGTPPPPVIPPVIPTLLSNNGGVVTLDDPAGWPTSDAGLLPGAVYYNGGVIGIVPGVTPDPTAPALIFDIVTSADLLAQGAGDLPLADPHRAFQLFNNFGEVAISL